MIPESITLAMASQPGSVIRASRDLPIVAAQLDTLGLRNAPQINEFFENYKLSGVLSKRSIELLDLCSPTPQIVEATEFGQDIYEIPDDFICLTSGEGEGFILYSKHDGKIYDVSVTQIDDLNEGKIDPTWPNFFKLIEWYLDNDDINQ